jgi:signal transduction histidine kinase
MPDRADNEAMANRERARRAAAKDARDHPNIEPGLLRIFRWYVAIRLGFGVLVLWSVRSEPDPTNPRFPGGGVFFFSLLMVLLVWPWAQRKLGRLFLPAALALATLGPIVESAQNITGRLDAGLSANEALADYWLPFFLLWVPLLLIAWQYRYRAVIAWAVVTTLLDAGSAIPPLEEAGADMAILTALVLARGALFAFVGLFVVKLIGGQRDARKSLATHAATLEELATSRERNRLARELHDTLAHSLSATAVQLEAVKALWVEEPDRAKEMLDQSLQRARGGLGEARRAIQALRASPLDERGLAGALDQLGAAAAARSSIEIQVTVDDRVGELGPQLEQAVYRIADEALTNVVRHSGATAAALELKKARNRLSLEVVDNGSGFEPDVPAGNGHVGLQGMRERAELVGGSLDVDSRPGEGTTVRFDVRTSQ